MSEGSVKQITKQGKSYTDNDILAELCVDAQSISTEVRNCLCVYDSKSTTNQLSAQFTHFDKKVLVKCLDFLGAKPAAQRTWDEYLKPTCVRELIVRIQNLLIDTCGFCNENYATGRDDKCYLKCCSCGQSAHLACVKKILGDRFSPEMTETDVTDIIFPFKVNAYHFCHECSKSLVPKETTGLKKVSKSKVAKKQPLPPLSQRTPPETETGVENIENHEIDLSNATVPTAETGDISLSQTQKSKFEETCIHYIKGVCKYGKTGEGCRFKHPPYCQKLLIYGPNHKDGCNKGSACEFVHPKLCYKSTEKHQCFNDKCRYFHIKGTKRVPAVNRRKGHHKNLKFEKQKSSQPNQGSSGLTTSKNQSQDFLKLFQQMKTDLLKEMDSKLSEVLTSQSHHQAPYYQPRNHQLYPTQSSRMQLMQSQPQQSPWNLPQTFHQSQI